jgi:cyclic lactone autoinducer peptide
MKTGKRLVNRAALLAGTFFSLVAITTLDIPCLWFWGQPKLPDKLRKVKSK